MTLDMSKKDSDVLPSTHPVSLLSRDWEAAWNNKPLVCVTQRREDVRQDSIVRHYSFQLNAIGHFQATLSVFYCGTRRRCLCEQWRNRQPFECARPSSFIQGDTQGRTFITPNNFYVFTVLYFPRFSRHPGRRN